MAKIIWSATAIEDLNAIAEYISLDSEYYASRYVKQLWNATLFLEEQPLAGKVVPEFNQENLREIVFGKYRIVYQYNENDICLLTIRHSAQLLKTL